MLWYLLSSFDGDSVITAGGMSSAQPNSSALFPTGTSAVLRLRRVGSTLMADADVGNGFFTLASATDPAFGSPAKVHLRTQGNLSFPSSPPRTISFDDFVITADQFLPIPEPCSLVLMGAGSVFFWMLRGRAFRAYPSRLS